MSTNNTASPMPGSANSDDDIRNSQIAIVLKHTYLYLSASLVLTSIFAWLSPCFSFSQDQLGFFSFIQAAAIFLAYAKRETQWSLAAVFIFAAASGITAGPSVSSVLSIEEGARVVSLSMTMAALIVAGLSVYVIYTKHEFTNRGGLSCACLVVTGSAFLASSFVPGIHAAVAAFSALFFSGFILYDTGKIVSGSERCATRATVSMYFNVFILALDFVMRKIKP